YPQLKLLKTIIRDRKVYRDCMAEGKGVVEMDNGKAKGEIQMLVKELLSD
ncbi:cobyrinic acid ac-diamide synthase, partial [Escherichia coli]|nr:cobyrinic acid ac-diamide synthase [Escherichia coli]